MLAALLPLLAPLIGKLADAFIPDPAAREKFIAQFFDSLSRADLSQIEVNKAEAASGNMFVAGWRPAIGWACAVALISQYVAAPWAEWLAWSFGWQLVPFPRFDQILWELMFGLLGMSALRSLEKIKNVGDK